MKRWNRFGKGVHEEEIGQGKVETVLWGGGKPYTSRGALVLRVYVGISGEVWMANADAEDVDGGGKVDARSLLLACVFCRRSSDPLGFRSRPLRSSRLGGAAAEAEGGCQRLGEEYGVDQMERKDDCRRVCGSSPGCRQVGD